MVLPSWVTVVPLLTVPLVVSVVGAERVAAPTRLTVAPALRLAVAVIEAAVAKEPVARALSVGVAVRLAVPDKITVVMDSVLGAIIVTVAKPAAVATPFATREGVIAKPISATTVALACQIVKLW